MTTDAEIIKKCNEEGYIFVPNGASWYPGPISSRQEIIEIRTSEGNFYKVKGCL